MHYTTSKPEASPLPNDWDRGGLPSWCYTNTEYFELEKDILFRRQWQIAGHISDVPEPGDYLCF